MPRKSEDKKIKEIRKNLLEAEALIVENFLKRVKAKEQLSASEIKTLDRLRGKYIEGAEDPPASAPGRETVNVKGAAKLLGVSEKTIRNRAKKGLIPRNSDGSFFVDVLINGSDENGAALDKEGKERAVKMQKADVRFRTARAELTEFDLRIKQGAFVALEDVEKSNEERLHILIRGVENFERNLINELSATSKKKKFIKDTVKEQIIEMRKEWGRGYKRLGK